MATEKPYQRVNREETGAPSKFGSGMREDEESRGQLVVWVAHEVMPHEPLVRAWLSRSMVAKEDIDDLIQDAYCRLSALDSHAHIERPGAFLFQTVRNLLINQIRHSRVVRIDAFVDSDLHAFSDETPSPERVAGDRIEWIRVQRLIDALPKRCRRIFEMRKIDGLSQRAIATKLGVSENVVENESSNGLRLIAEALRAEGDMIAGEYQARRDRSRRTR